jgi:hypothetical protein
VILENYGCLERDECDSNSACGLIGTPYCPFLQYYCPLSPKGDGVVAEC